MSIFSILQKVAIKLSANAYQGLYLRVNPLEDLELWNLNLVIRSEVIPV